MKIGLQTWGSDGDIRPFMALARQLSESGHDVTVAYTSSSNKDYSQFSSTMNIKLNKVNKEFCPDKDTVLAKFPHCKNHIERSGLAFKYLFEPAVEEMYEASKTLCKENEVVIGHNVLHPLLTASEKANCPRISVTFCPRAIESSSLSPTGHPGRNRMMNYLRWRAVDRVMRKEFFPSIDRLRRREGLPTVSRILQRLTLGDLALLPVSSTLCRREKGWADTVHLTGFLDIPSSMDNFSMPADLEAFLGSGAPPVYFTFGSLASVDMEQTKHLFLETANKIGTRAIIQADWDKTDLLRNSPSLFLLNNAPYHQVFPHCSVVVHHGGAGTTQSACYSGCPSVVVEHAFDQQYWGDRLFQAGVAGSPLHRKTITTQKLVTRIKSVLASTSMQEKAHAIGKVMRAEKGAAVAVKLIEDRFK